MIFDSSATVYENIPFSGNDYVGKLDMVEMDRKAFSRQAYRAER